ncbi:MAG: hypothetical protein IE916_11170 [Epsilonproteobacteria bacterium]|nr:hypothetical protein [Campylobacterota bacterium]
MLEVMQFIFSSFWVWLGTLILISAPFTAAAKFLEVKFKYTKEPKPSQESQNL